VWPQKLGKFSKTSKFEVRRKNKEIFPKKNHQKLRKIKVRRKNTEFFPIKSS